MIDKLLDILIKESQFGKKNCFQIKNRINNARSHNSLVIFNI